MPAVAELVRYPWTIEAKRQETGPMGRLIKYLFWIAVLGALGLAAYAMLAELPPPTEKVVIELPSPQGQ